MSNVLNLQAIVFEDGATMTTTQFKKNVTEFLAAIQNGVVKVDLSNKQVMFVVRPTLSVEEAIEGALKDAMASPTKEPEALSMTPIEPLKEVLPKWVKADPYAEYRTNGRYVSVYDLLTYDKNICDVRKTAITKLTNKRMLNEFLAEQPKWAGWINSMPVPNRRGRPTPMIAKRLVTDFLATVAKTKTASIRGHKVTDVVLTHSVSDDEHVGFNFNH